MNEALKMAIKYAEKGWYVFPIQPGSKFPYKGFKWRRQSVNDPEKIRAAASHPKYKNCNWGLDCGKSDLYIIDVDVKNGVDGRENLKKLNISTNTYTVTTPSGGLHLYYRGKGRNSVSTLAPGIDTRGEGGYVIIPGSINEKGLQYKISNRTEPISLPDQIKKHIKPPTERKKDYEIPITDPDQEHNIQRAKNWLINQAPEAHEGGGGDAATFKIACRLRDFGISQETALDLLLEHWNDDKAFPPWTPTDLQKKVQNAFRYAADRPGNATPEALFNENKSTSLIRCAADTRINQIKPREWLLGYRYILGYTTLTIAPGGAGKSLLTILEGLSVASGKRLTHDEVKQQGAVWLFNTEDPFDELDRRIIAAAKHHGLTKDDLSNFYYSSSYENPLTLVAYDDKNRPIQNTNLINSLIKQIKSRSIKLFIVDPFVECHQVNENDNAAINMVMRAFRKIAEETGCAISIVHHTSKGTKDVHGNMDKARGASALASAARIAHTFYTMSEKEASQYGLPAQKHRWYARLDSAKANLAPPAEAFEWYEKKSIKLWFDHEETTGVLEAVKLDRIMKEDTHLMIAEAAMRLVDMRGTISLLEIGKEIEAGGMTGKKARSIADSLAKTFNIPLSNSGRVYSLSLQPNAKGVMTRMLSAKEEV